jgi:hypothetical protein
VRAGLKRSLLTLDRQVSAPVTSKPQGATCLTCLRLVEQEEIVDGLEFAEGAWSRKEFCKVLVRCHGAEELRTFDMGSTNWDGADLKRFMQSAEWFDPTSHNEAPVGKPADLSQEYE